MDSPARSIAIPPILQESCDDSFLFRLNDRLSWNFAGTEGTGEWLRKWAQIMGLTAGQDKASPTVWFVRGAPVKLEGARIASVPDCHILESLARDGWQVNDLRLIRIWWHPSLTDIVCELFNTPLDHIEATMMWQALHPVYQRVIMLGGAPLHAALVTHQGKGFILAGAGGRGKTTCCERLPSGWSALSDDETLLVRTSLGKPTAHPFPTWGAPIINGKSWNVSVNVPVTAIFFLEQAAEDSATPLGQGEAAVRINESANQSCFSRLRSLPPSSRTEWRRVLFQNSCDIAGDIPAYRLETTKTGRFWEIIEEATQREEEINHQDTKTPRREADSCYISAPNSGR
jgi:SynChlorMet cassette protein ScmC